VIVITSNLTVSYRFILFPFLNTGFIIENFLRSGKFPDRILYFSFRASQGYNI